MTKPIISFHRWLNRHPKFRWLSFVPTIVWAGLIFWLSNQSYLPNLATPWSEFLWKKTAHFLIFGGLYFWLWWGQRLNQPLHPVHSQNSASLSLFWLILVLLYAISDELHQSFVVNRHPSTTDIGIDLLGASSFALSLWRYHLWPKNLIKLTGILILPLKKV